MPYRNSSIILKGELQLQDTHRVRSERFFRKLLASFQRYLENITGMEIVQVLDIMIKRTDILALNDIFRILQGCSVVLKSYKLVHSSFSK